jgi:hypothetical protein
MAWRLSSHKLCAMPGTRQTSAAAGSGSAADALGSQLQGLVSRHFLAIFLTITASAVIDSREKQPFYPRKTHYRPILRGHFNTIPHNIRYLPWPDPITTLQNITNDSFYDYFASDTKYQKARPHQPLNSWIFSAFSESNNFL